MYGWRNTFDKWVGLNKNLVVCWYGNGCGVIKMRSFVNAANFLSFLRILITPCVVWIILYYQQGLYLGVALFTLAAITDTCDGYIARRYGLMTELGNFLDPFADKVLIFSTFISFYSLSLLPLWFVLLVVIRDTCITVIRCLLVRKQRPLKTSMLGKWKTTLQIALVYVIFLGMLFGDSYCFLAISLHSCTLFLTYIVAAITAYSGFSYLRALLYL